MDVHQNGASYYSNEVEYTSSKDIKNRDYEEVQNQMEKEMYTNLRRNNIFWGGTSQGASPNVENSHIHNLGYAGIYILLFDVK